MGYGSKLVPKEALKKILAGLRPVRAMRGPCLFGVGRCFWARRFMFPEKALDVQVRSAEEVRAVISQVCDRDS
jgi:hypothetical protein